MDITVRNINKNALLDAIQAINQSSFTLINSRLFEQREDNEDDQESRITKGKIDNLNDVATKLLEALEEAERG